MMPSWGRQRQRHVRPQVPDAAWYSRRIDHDTVSNCLAWSETALELGYSDDVVVWLNGALLFRGINGFNSRYPGFLGLVVPAAEHLGLPLRAGDNSLVIAVGGRTFGWGLKARVVRRE
jgi:hypothetical protein